METSSGSFFDIIGSVLTNTIVPIFTFIFDFTNPIGATISIILLLSIIGGLSYAFLHK